METQETTAPPSLMNHAIKNGVILGIISIVIVVLAYAVDISFMATFKFMGLMFVIGIGFVIYAGISYRNEVGGYLGYGQALQHGFLVFAISGLVSTLFQLVLYTVIDPDLAQKMTEAIITNTEEMMANFGAPQESIDQAVEKMRVDMASQFGVGGLLLGYCKALIAYLILALITALFVRKNQPVEI